MSIRRYVLGRLIAWLIISILAAAFGVRPVHAQSYPDCGNISKATANCPNQGAAYQHVYAYASHYIATHPNPQSRKVCIWQHPTAPSYTGGSINVAITCAMGVSMDGFTGADWPAGQTCTARGAASGSCNANLGGHCTKACFGGCEEVFTHTRPEDDWTITEGSQIGYWKQGTWTPTGATCTDDDPQDPPDDCPAGQKKLTDGTCGKQGDCPVGMHEVPATGACTPDGACPTGQQKAPDGSCVAEQCPTGFAKKKDGTCGLDQDGDGNVDDEEEGNDNGDKASGGDSCDSPPTCSGNAILCLQTKIQWRIDCNTRKQRNVTGGACSSPPICTGEKCDALEYSSLMMQWRTACATEKLNSGGAGGGVPGDGDGDGQPDWTEADGSGPPDETGNPADGKQTNEFGGEGFDDSGFGFGRSCPDIPSVNVFGHVVDIDQNGVVCQWLQLGGIFVLIIASIASLLILMRA